MSAARQAGTKAATTPARSCGKKQVLVDFENVPKASLDGLDATTEVIVFVGAMQKTAPIELAMAAQHLGSRLQWRRVGASGRNALDFFIACELGRILATAPDTHCIVISNDKGFDPLLRHLTAQGLKCTRKGELSAPAATPQPASRAATKPAEKPAAKPASEPSSDYGRVTATLGKSARNRPARRSTLKNHVAAMFQNRKSEAEVEKIIAQLQKDGRISLNGEKVSYTL